MKMKDLYKNYFQKSHAFLYPLLKIRRVNPKPDKTYIRWGDSILPEDHKLICVYDRLNTPIWQKFERTTLMPHSMLIDSIELDNDKVAYVFDMDVPDMREDFEEFLKGRYSKFSQNAKKALSTYYGVHTPEWVYIESYIHPQRYFKIYSEILNVKVNLLKEAGELCDKHDEEKENCPHQYPMVNI